MPGNPPMGAEFWRGDLKVLLLKFNNIDLGKTLDDTTLEAITDVKDIMYAQDGTQPADKVYTGMAWKLTCKIAETSNIKLALLKPGTTAKGLSSKVGRDLYRSGLANFAKRLEAAAIDSEGVASTDVHQRFIAPLAFPSIKGSIDFGPSKQRYMEVEFYFFFDHARGVHMWTGNFSSV
jgi:hypothetical protein